MIPTLPWPCMCKQHSARSKPIACYEVPCILFRHWTVNTDNAHSWRQSTNTTYTRVYDLQGGLLQPPDCRTSNPSGAQHFCKNHDLSRTRQSSHPRITQKKKLRNSGYREFIYLFRESIATQRARTKRQTHIKLFTLFGRKRVLPPTSTNATRAERPICVAITYGKGFMSARMSARFIVKPPSPLPKART